MCRRIAGVFLVLIFLASAVAGYFVYTIFSPAPGASARAPLSPIPTPSQERSAEQTVERLRQQVTEPSGVVAGDENPRFRTRRRHAHGPVELHVTQQEANDLLTGLPDVRKTLSEQKVTAPEISFRPDRIEATAQFPVYRGLSARVTAVGRIWAQNGRLAYRTEDVYLGDLPAPARVRRELDKSLRDAVRNLNRNINGKLDEVRITDGELMLRVRS